MRFPLGRQLLANLSIPRKLTLIVIVFSLIIGSLLALSLVGMEFLSGVRAYVGGEGLWSKAQKDAVYYLRRYANDRDEGDYQKYLSYMAVPLGDRKARLESQKPDVRLEDVYQGFLEGRNHPQDVRILATFFQRFQHVSYMKEAIIIWTEADREIGEIEHVGFQMHEAISSGHVSDQTIVDLLAKVDAVNQKLTPLEDQFSYTLGEGARWLRGILQLTMVGATAFFLLGGILIANFISKHLTREVLSLKAAAARIAAGDYSQRIAVESRDEIGDLAVAFQQMADQRNQSERLKDEFFANVSHELRTPLTLILAPLESLLFGDRVPEFEEARKNLEMMHNNTIRLLQMVNGLLDFSKLEAGRVEVNREGTDVKALTQSLLSDFGPLMEQKGLTVEFKQEGLPAVLMDRFLYERILFNLLSNAAKFTPRGGHIIVSLILKQERLKLSVRDTGIGIAAAEVKNLFQKFRQLEGSSTRRFEGSGLGLALVKEFAELLGGTVSVQSSPGSGSLFAVDCFAPSLPGGSEDGIKEVQEPKRVLVQRFTAAPLSVKSVSSHFPKVLVVEDNVELAGYIASILKGFCQTLTVYDGEEALKQVRAWEPDLLLTDVMIPKRDGLSLCRDIKTDPKTRHIPVVLLTALTHREALLKGWEAGADEYLFKPFHPVELTTRIKSILQAVLERRKADDLLQKSHEELERKVRERTRELKVKNEELERLTRVKDNFVTTVTHELRTPLSAIMQGLSLILEEVDGPVTESQRETIGIMNRNLNRLSRMVGNVLDFQKLDSGLDVLHWGSVDIRDAVREVCETMKWEALSKKFSLRVDTPEEPLPINGDEDRIKQVILNLLDNAFKFTDPQGEIAVQLKRLPDHVLLAVRNTGSVIGKDDQQKIFNMFSQLPYKGIWKTGGVGVGLAICKKIMELHQGQIRVESEEGKGTCFSASFPIHESS